MTNTTALTATDVKVIAKYVRNNHYCGSTWAGVNGASTRRLYDGIGYRTYDMDARTDAAIAKLVAITRQPYRMEGEERGIQWETRAVDSLWNVKVRISA